MQTASDAPGTVLQTTTVRVVLGADGGLLAVPRADEPTAAELRAIESEWALCRRLPNAAAQPEATERGDGRLAWRLGGSGVPLSTRLAGSPLDAGEALALLAAGFSALAELEAAGVVHRRLEPRRILWDADAGRVTLLGFDCAALAGTVESSPLSVEPDLLRYLAPEVSGALPRPTRGAADRYSLGAIVYGGLSGRHVHRQEGVLDLLHAQVTSVPPSLRVLLPGLPRPLADLIDSLLAQDPHQRPGDAGALADALRACADEVARSGAWRIDHEPAPAPGLRWDGPLVGRGAELSALEEALHDAHEAGPVLVRVAGPSGAGRSTLLRAFAEFSLRQRAEVRTVRFEPAAAGRLPVRFDRAIQELMRSRTLGSSKFAGGAGGLASVVDLAERWRPAAAAGRPAVLLVDDLHHADEMVWRQLRFLVRIGGLRGLLIVASERVGESPSTLDDLDDVRRLDLEPLPRTDVIQWLGHVLGGAEDPPLRDAAGALHRQGGGNPGAIRTLIAERVAHGELARDEAGVWRPAPGASTAPEPPTPDARRLAQTLAVLQRDVDQLRLGQILGWDVPRTEAAAASARAHASAVPAPASRLGPLAANPVLRAIAPSEPSSEDRALRLAAGRVALRDPGSLEDQIEGATLLAERFDDLPEAEREAVLSHLVEAAERILALGGASMASGLAETALGLLERSATASAERLLRARVAAAEAAWRLGDGARVDELTRLTEAVQAAPAEHRPLWTIRLTAATAAGRMDDAIADGLTLLTWLGRPLPQRQVGARTVGRLIALRAGWSTARIAGLTERPRTDDAAVGAAIAVLSLLAPAILYAQPDLVALSILTQLRTMLREGFTDDAPFCLAGCVILLGDVLGEHERARAWGTLAVELADRVEDPRHRVRCQFVVALYFHQLYAPPGQTLAHLEACHRDGRATGELEYAGFALSTQLWERMWMGQPLAAVSEECGIALAELEALEHHATVGWFDPLRRFVAGLLDQEVRDPEVAPPRHTVGGGWAESWLACWRALLDDDPATAATQADAAWERIDNGRGTKGVPAFLAYAVLAWSRASGDGRPVAAALRLLARWLPANPAEIGHRLDLARGADAERRGDEEEAIRCWHRALEAAVQGGFVYDVALLHEQLARVHGAHGRATMARTHGREAVAAYRQWGAVACLRRLARQDPLAQSSPGLGAVGSVTSEAPNVSAATQASLEALLDAATLLSSEQDLDRLVSRLLGLSARFAGADRAGLVLRRDDVWWVEGVVSGDGPEVGLPSRLVDVEARCPALRLGPLLAGGDDHDELPSGGHPWHDGYLDAAGVRSFFAWPLEHAGERRGAIWFENRLAEGVFGPHRRPMLKLFSQQLVAVLEAGRLLDRTRRLKEAYGRFVPHDLVALLGQGSVEKVSVGQHVVRTMPVLFTDIRGFTRLSERLGPEGSFAVVQQVLGALEPEVRRFHGIVDKYIGDALLALFPGGCAAAVSAAVAMVEAARALNASRTAAGEVPLQIGVGINVGTVILGAVGTDQRLDTTVLSDAVNLASRLEGLTKRYGCSIVISQAVAEQLPEGRFARRPLERIRVRGRRRSELVFEVYEADEAPLRSQKDESGVAFGAAVTAYGRGELDEALGGFRALNSGPVADPVAGRLADILRAKIAGDELAETLERSSSELIAGAFPEEPSQTDPAAPVVTD